MPISKRATETLAIQSPMMEAFLESISKLYEPELNPTGALNLGVAHNDLLQQKVFEKAQECLLITPEDINYGAAEGSPRLRQIWRDFFTRHFNPIYPLQWHDIFTQTGAGASINQLFMVICDPGDYCLVPTPYYGAFDYDVGVNTGVKIFPMHLHRPDLNTMTVDPDLLETHYQRAQSEGKKITSMIVTNPENPLGRCYSVADIKEFLRFGSRHQIHMVFDEIYALSTYSQLLDNEEKKKEDPFVSVLSLPYKDFIDPALVHVVYGLSKDFAINGFRVGFIIDQFNKPLKSALYRSA
ncbi:hypothetical protein HPULCUR_002380 [Helicostylum pulchrum]|uniref:Aminotransferase class I/classII large domain-containing protein n=1 Tax=Helicostylum pulchrum TaxID=562976 RepID=A0ABP9XSD7_9FUNG